jgi:hypothetical protein
MIFCGYLAAGIEMVHSDVSERNRKLNPKKCSGRIWKLREVD